MHHIQAQGVIGIAEFTTFPLHVGCRNKDRETEIEFL